MIAVEALIPIDTSPHHGYVTVRTLQWIGEEHHDSSAEYIQQQMREAHHGSWRPTAHVRILPHQRDKKADIRKKGAEYLKCSES
jgi:hypothetical protein